VRAAQGPLLLIYSALPAFEWVKSNIESCAWLQIKVATVEENGEFKALAIPKAAR
jgi:hypothetical protein